MGNLGGPGSIHAVLGLASIEVKLQTHAPSMSKHITITLQSYFDLVCRDPGVDCRKSKRAA